MVGIRALGAYIPKYRLGQQTVGWETATEKAIANFDEDSITMAVAAGVDCLRGVDRSQVDALYFATTTSPYLEKQAAATIATALDLRRDIATSDFTNVLRAGTVALKGALDAIKAGSAKEVLVVAADSRMATPKSEMDRNLGDGAVALLVSGDHVAAEVEGTHSISEHMLDVWRPTGEAFLRAWEDRFVIEEGFQRVMTEAVSGILKKYGVTPKDFAKAVYYSPDGRRHTEMGRRLGFTPAQIQDPLYGKMGNTGAAFPLMLLVSALEDAKLGDRILLASYGDGADAVMLRVKEGIEGLKTRRGIKKHLASKTILPNYDLYMRWRDLAPSEAARRPAPMMPSISAQWRESAQNLKLYGAKCKACGKIQYPPQRVCTWCSAKDQFESVRLSDKRGTVYTYAMDYISGSVDVPLVLTVINFDGGGRMLCTMTDRDIENMKINMPVEMTFRKLRTVSGVHNYYWKSTPIRVAD